VFSSKEYESELREASVKTGAARRFPDSVGDDGVASEGVDGMRRQLGDDSDLA
jgi:hypothetical protein